MNELIKNKIIFLQTSLQSMLNRRALSDVVETPGRRREETRAVEMVRVGQALKLEAIVHGLAPTSLATVGPLKPRPWEPRCIYPDFPHDVVCGDVWSEGRLVIATEYGTYLVEGETFEVFFFYHVSILYSITVEYMNDVCLVHYLNLFFDFI